MHKTGHERESRDSRCRFSLVLPFYNEEGNIVPVVTGLKSTLDRAGIDFQLVLVANGSLDRTPELLKGLVGGEPRLKPVFIEKNIGFGWGVINGLRAADGDWIGFMDGDAQVVPGDVERFLSLADPVQCDMLKTRRLSRQDGFVRTRVAVIYVKLFCLIFGIPVYDLNAKPVIFRREWLPRFNLSSRDWFIDAELMLKACFLGLRIREFPLVSHRRSVGRSSVTPATALEFLRNIVRYSLGGEFRRWQNSRR